MDKGILTQCTDMQAEIKELQRLIAATQDRLDKMRKEGQVSDVVNGGMGGTQHFKVSGFPTPRYTREKNLLLSRQRRLEAKELELLELQNKAEEYIESIEKSEMRMIMRLRFIEGLTCRQIADRMNWMYPKRNIAYTDENIKKKIQRFFEMSPNVP